MSLWVLGTDTAVGKTVITALILNRHGREGGLAYWKPVSTGGDTDRDRSTISALLPPQVDVLDETYLFELPASPHLAARVEGAAIDPERILEDHRRNDHGRLVIEGAGGVLVPLNDRHMLIDTVVATGLPVVLVARSTLGTINHTLLTLEALRSRGVEVLGVVLNGPPDEDNARAIETFGKTAIISQVSPLPGEVPSKGVVARAARDFDPDGLLIEPLTLSS